MMTTAYLFEPKSSLVLRTGRPFDQAGDPVSLSFPMPSTMAGACRTAIGDEQGWNFADKVEELKSITVHGPLAAIIGTKNIVPLFPRPWDMAYLRDQDATPTLFRLSPETLQPDEWSDLPNGLLPVFLEKTLKAKPVPGDTWWTMEHIISWLLGDIPSETDPNKMGWKGPDRELRTHVSIDRMALAAEDGNLFQTEGLSFSSCRKSSVNHQGWQESRYGILIHLPEHSMDKTSAQRIGGEGKICSVCRLDSGWPDMPEKLEKKINSARGIRLILVTPSLFSGGWCPGNWLDDDLRGSPPGFEDEINLRLRAFVAPRWQPISGWDLQKKQPRAVRRMVPAGSVYWFDVENGADNLSRLWLQSISDNEQDRRDGFGLVIPGIWEK
jgi:CRISPR-associated protein Cmr3